MLPQHDNRKRLAEPVSQTGSMEINHKRQAQGMHGYEQTSVAIKDMSVGSSKGVASGSKCVDKELSTGHVSQKAKPRRQVSKLHQVKINIVKLKLSGAT